MFEDSISSRGGARIGWMNATWPFAVLTARQAKLDLNATLLGKYSFTPDQVISLEKYGCIPILGSGIRIHHNIADYSKNESNRCQAYTVDRYVSMMYLD